jgi:hypothetical protein
VRELVIDALDDTALKSLQDSAERIITRIDDPRDSISPDAAAITASSTEKLKP